MVAINESKSFIEVNLIGPILLDLGRVVGVGHTRLEVVSDLLIYTLQDDLIPPVKESNVVNWHQFLFEESFLFPNVLIINKIKHNLRF